ncbi:MULTISPECIES: OmpA family protein [Methylophaga]|uniref:Outer membrane protein and related peptidoglycan-associated protein n=1 Tax=Methylophaga aminisulfidivorans MP TaxID=1026882 RepID=F5SW95_9GAMM|nr:MULTISPECIES: OmpA family protein [Methylophaga]EGL56143.1 outer membrane protein and related peptidoglycan-associated protein [Methylophaga aminisulfidivorans MP]WVI86015.1 OmpA family protein [Methylophaga thalassica]
MKKIVLVSLIAAALSGCAADDPNQKTKTGAAIGAAAGALLGYAVDDGAGGVLAGAAVGALAGGGVGHYMDKQQQEMEAALADERARNELKIQQLENETLKIDIASEVSFDFDSASLKSAFTPTLNKVSDILQRYPNTIIHVVGYTDSVGSESYNMKLSERRAQSVVDYLSSRGVSSSRLYAIGKGESDPRATNDTEAGRQLNRRVELFVKPVIEGQESEAYQTP